MTTTDPTQPEPMPTPGETSVTRLVIADLLERERQGIAKYGTTLQTFNGRDALVDAYQESIDQTQYLRQALEERNIWRQRAEAAESAMVQMAADVRKWVCERCNTVYPGPPSPGVLCITCPQCNGSTMPMATWERRRLREQLAVAEREQKTQATRLARICEIAHRGIEGRGFLSKMEEIERVAHE